MKAILALVVVALIGAAAWFFVGPLFVDDVVDEPFDPAAPGAVFELDRVLAMPPEQQAAQRSDIMRQAAAMPDHPMAEPMPTSAPAQLRAGQFQDADAAHQGSGNVLLYQLADGAHLVRFEDFRATNGPDLRVYLATHPAPASAADVTDGGYVSLGKLKGNVGSQNYPVPATVDVSDYGSVVIWCELFGVLFATASLN